jgi:hypothetical protein
MKLKSRWNNDNHPALALYRPVCQICNNQHFVWKKGVLGRITIDRGKLKE